MLYFYLDQFLVGAVKAAVDCRYLVVAAAAVVASPSYLDQLLQLRSQDSGIPDRKEAISDSKSFVGCRLQDVQKAKICCRCDRVGVHLQQKRDQQVITRLLGVS